MSLKKIICLSSFMFLFHIWPYDLIFVLLYILYYSKIVNTAHIILSKSKKR